MSEGTNYGHDNPFFGCTEDTIEFMANAHFTHNNKKVSFRNKDGSPKLDACLYALGFDQRPKYLAGKIIRDNEKDLAIEDLDMLLVRHPLQLDKGQYTKVYAGRLRAGYEPPKQLEYWLKQIHFEADSGIMHVVCDKPLVDLAEETTY